MTLGKAVGKASQTLFLLSADENPGHKPKVLFVLRLNKSPKRATNFGPYNRTLVLRTRDAFLRRAEDKRRAAPLADVAMPPALQGGADTLERLSHTLCFAPSWQWRERSLNA